jgi:IS5 family transposase
MQGKPRMDRELLDAGEMAGHLVPPGSVFAFLAGHRRELFPDSFTADLFPWRTGRPSLPADLAGSVLVLKELHDLSDPQTAEALSYDIRWKVACGRSLDQMSFDPSTLVYWRKRIAESERPLRAARAQARTDDFKKACPTRSAIERIISWTATQNGRRVRLRYLGTAKNNAWLHTRCAAINLRTLLRHGLTRRDGAWTLA